jgi:hypothetical protein
MSRVCGCGGCEAGGDDRVELSADVALEAAQDVFAAVAEGGAAGGVGAGARVVHEAYGRDDPERGVGGAVAAAVEPVAVGLAGGGVDWAGAA